MATTTDDIVIMPIKTKRSTKEQASKLFQSRGLTMTAGVNMLLTELIARKSFSLSFDTEEGIIPLSSSEKSEIDNLSHLSSFLNSIPG